MNSSFIPFLDSLRTPRGRPQRTAYRLVTTGVEAALCEEVRRLADEPLHLFEFPTIYAVREDRALGYLGREADPDGDVVLGPLVLDPRLGLAQRAFLALRLWEAMGVILMQAGVTDAFFRVDATRADYLARLARVGFPAWRASVDGDVIWFRVRLGGGVDGRA